VVGIVVVVVVGVNGRMEVTVVMVVVVAMVMGTIEDEEEAILSIHGLTPMLKVLTAAIEEVVTVEEVDMVEAAVNEVAHRISNIHHIRRRGRDHIANIINMVRTVEAMVEPGRVVDVHHHHQDRRRRRGQPITRVVAASVVVPLHVEILITVLPMEDKCLGMVDTGGELVDTNHMEAVRVVAVAVVAVVITPEAVLEVVGAMPGMVDTVDMV